MNAQGIHPTAVVDPRATLGKNVRVGPYTSIEHDVRIGDDCVIGPRVSVLAYTTLAPECHVHAGAVLGDTPQDIAFDGAETYLEIGRGTIIREGVTIHRGTKAGTTTVIGERCMLMGHTHFAHNVVLGNEVAVVNGALVGGYAEIGNRAFISGNCLIHQFVRIGRLAMMGGGSAATKDVPPFFMLPPLTCNTVSGINVIGLRRAGFAAEQRSEIKAAFHALYRSGLNVTQALDRLRAAAPSEHTAEICDFVAASKRGICDGPQHAGAG